MADKTISIGNSSTIIDVSISGNLVAAKLNSHTLEADVPSNAVFTDTQSDWNATSGKAVILNKPSIPTESTVAGWGFSKFNGDYNSLTNKPIEFLTQAEYDAITEKDSNKLYIITDATDSGGGSGSLGSVGYVEVEW